MAQKYKFITSGSVGTIQLYPSGEVVTVFSGSDGNISVQGDFVCFTADTKRYSIAFDDVIKSDNTPCASVNEAAEYVGGIIATYAGGGGGGGGGDATAANQINGSQKTQVVGDTGVPMVVEADGSINVNAIPQGIPYSFVKRLQVSDTQMQFDAKHLKDKLPLLFNEILNGAATSTWNTNRVDMTVTNAGDYAIRQSFRHFNYTSDRPILFAFTQQSLQPQAGSVKRVGAFNGGIVAPYTTFDGVFVESDATITALKVYTGGVLANSVDITSWLNGANTMDLTGGTIFECEYLWLGYGGVRLSTYINGSKVVAAQIFFDQAASNPFFNSPNKPIRYEIRSTGGAASFSQVCSAVQTEGSSSFLGLDYAIDSGTTAPLLNNTGTRYIMAAIRLKSTHLDMSSLIEEFSAMFTSNDDALVEVIINPTTTTGVITFADVDTNVNLQRFIASGTITQTLTAFPAQNKLFSRYARQGTAIDGRLDGKRRLGSSINGTPDTIYFCITPLSAALNALISIKLSDIN